MIMDYDTFQQAIRDGTGVQVLSRWVSDILGEVAQGRTKVSAMRHPLGFMCFPVERSGDQGICVHLWNDSMPKTNPTTSPMHAHSWDLLSCVLYGNVRNELIDVTDVPDEGTHRVFEIRSRGDVDEVRETPRLVRCRTSVVELNHRGDTYSLAAGAFHATVVQGEAATVALGRGYAGMLDLSLGGIDTRTHYVRRQRCDRDETAYAARVVIERLARICSVDQEDDESCEDRDGSGH